MNIVYLLCGAVRDKAFELLALHADQRGADRVVQLLSVSDVVHLPQRLDLPHRDVRRQGEHPHVDFPVVRSRERAHDLELLSLQASNERADRAPRSGGVVRLLKPDHFLDRVFRDVEQRQPLEGHRLQRLADQHLVHEIKVLVPSRRQSEQIVVVLALVHEHPAERVLPGTVQVRLHAVDRRQKSLDADERHDVVLREHGSHRVHGARDALLKVLPLVPHDELLAQRGDVLGSKDEVLFDREEQQLLVPALHEHEEALARHFGKHLVYFLADSQRGALASSVGAQHRAL